MPDNETTSNFVDSSAKVEKIIKISFLFALILNVVASSKSTIDYYVAMI